MKKLGGVVIGGVNAPSPETPHGLNGSLEIVMYCT